jgi:hypothetical protein
MSFAENTTVSVEKTRAEIESLARKHGATEFSSGYTLGEAGLSFTLKNRRVTFSITTPSDQDKDLRKKALGMRGAFSENLKKVIDAENRRLWRCLLLRIKAKFVAADNNAVFEEEFLAHFETPNGGTLIQHIRALEQGTGPKLLASITKS